MRRIDYIVVHTTATPQTATVESITRYWREVKGWRTVGYHKVVPPNGATVRLAPDSAVTNGVAGHNSNSLHVSYIGGVDAKGRALDNRTPQQKAELERIITAWLALYPNAKVVGHRDFPGVKKACPSFDVAAWWASVK
ncbi:N-acetylmuramoyl-L-alanine amidase [Hymenobacter latericus]|uniref:N-acetylmuramoyl-L-alanine amidase n=1 Tax=Hymenobacter sp. YIM 151858-1 TaxID=2987688 RepID=UPI002225EB5A|nr:N-acetylmuramoyl-L-alanine amidase [Hymenobacter sp. YIM 151858-1]UYZ60135.1 N-acetylmuramoyl-L-alanine amidase [Hymenobacter sp. YIM 151858-1]